MKVRSLISCILMSILVILLFSMVAQANEYREANTEVKAEEILKHIENGDNIILDNCSIVGELNVSKINLKTVPNPDFDKLASEGAITESHEVTRIEVMPGGVFHQIKLNENLRVIESNITIINSIFIDNLDLSNVQFKNCAIFENTNFISDAYFYETDFNNYTDFSNANFNSIASFFAANFSGPTEFLYVNFMSDAYFFQANFNNHADFSGAYFNSYAGFSRATFRNDADFSTDFSWAYFNSDAYFYGTNFNSDVNFWGPDTSENIMADGKTCGLFIKSYNNEARYTDADNIYYNFRKHEQENKDLTSFSKWTDILSWITCGYGLRLSHTIGCIISILVVFSYLYWGGSRFYPLSNTTEKKLSRLDSVLLSIKGFTTLGTGEWYSNTYFFRIFVTLEGLLGWIMLGIFMATLTNVLMRS